jgi:ABC-2 type transport system permease protein
MIDSFLVLLPTAAVSFLQFFSASSHFTSISRGILDTRDILYFLSLTALFFGLSVKSIENRRNA